MRKPRSTLQTNQSQRNWRKGRVGAIRTQMYTLARQTGAPAGVYSVIDAVCSILANQIEANYIAVKTALAEKESE